LRGGEREDGTGPGVGPAHPVSHSQCLQIARQAIAWQRGDGEEGPGADHLDSRSIISTHPSIKQKRLASGIRGLICITYQVPKVWLAFFSTLPFLITSSLLKNLAME